MSCCIVFKHLPLDRANIICLYCITPPINRHEKHVQDNDVPFPRSDLGLCDGSDLETCLPMRGLGPGVVYVVGVWLSGLFCSCVWSCVLLDSCLSFISFLNLELYVLGVDALVSWVFFTQARHLCVLVRIGNGSEIATIKHVKHLQ